MKAAEMKERPTFTLMKQTDVQSIYHMQMPRWLFSDPRYADMSLDTKVTYTFLLNRFQLSRRNGWVNDYGEVFVIFPQKELARELRIGEKRVTAAFQRLAELALIWEKCCGRGDANQIYLASVQPVDDPSYSCAPFVPSGQEHDGSRTVETAAAEPPDLRLSYNNTRKKNRVIHTSVGPFPHGQADDEAELMDILDACELSFFEPETAKVFENAIERLFYSDNLRIGKAILPVRSRLHLLDGMILRTAESKLHTNLDRPIRNSTAYTMATIFNCIAEGESDLMVDPYLNSLHSRRIEGDASAFVCSAEVHHRGAAEIGMRPALVQGKFLEIQVSDRLFTVATLSDPLHSSAQARDSPGRIVWISDSGAAPPGLFRRPNISLPPASRTAHTGFIARMAMNISKFFKEDYNMPRKKITKPKGLDQTTNLDQTALTEGTADIAADEDENSSLDALPAEVPAEPEADTTQEGEMPPSAGHPGAAGGGRCADRAAC